MKRSSQTPLLLMALTVLIDFTGFGLILPLLPFWAERVGANPLQVSLLITVYALAQFVFTPILGSISDRYGRKPVILWSLIIEAISLALTAVSGTLALLLIARLIGGLGASNIGSAQAVVADTTAPQDRARGMGMIGAAIGLGFVIGPALGGILAGSHGSSLPFWVAMVIALINAGLVVWKLPETNVHRSSQSDPTRVSAPAALFSGWGVALSNPAILRLIIINLLFTIAFTGMETVFPLFTQRLLNWNAVQNGYVFAYVGVIVVIMQGGLVGQLVKRFGEQRLLFSGLVLLGAGLLLLPLAHNVGVILISLALLSIGDGAVSPTSSALLSIASKADSQGQTLGLSQGIGGLGRVIGPLIAGTLFLPHNAGLPFVIGGAFALVGAAIAIPAVPRLVKPQSTGQAQPQTLSQLPAKEASVRYDQANRQKPIQTGSAKSKPRTRTTR